MSFVGDCSLNSTVIRRIPSFRKSLGWLGLTGGKPRGRSQCVWGRPHEWGSPRSGSAANHPDSGIFGRVEFREESRQIHPFLPTCHYPIVDHSRVAGAAKRQSTKHAGRMAITPRSGMSAERASGRATNSLVPGKSGWPCVR